MIASLYNQKGGAIIGYRILDTDNNSILNVPTNSLISNLSSRAATIENMKFEDGRLIGTNGALERYPKCDMHDNSFDKGGSPIIIINRLGDVGFTISDYKGNIKKVKTQDVINYAEKVGIANGKIVTFENTKFISAISGNYEIIPIEEPEQPKPAVEQPKEVEQSKPVEPVKTVVKDNILNDEQVMAVARYYQYFQNREAQLRGTSDNAKEVSKKEVELIKEAVRTGTVEAINYRFGKFIYIVHLVNDEEKLGNLTNNVFIHSFIEFLSLGLPIVESMGNIFLQYMIQNEGNFIEALIGDLDIAHKVYKQGKNKPNDLTHKVDRLLSGFGTHEDVDDLINEAKHVEIAWAIGNKLITTLQQNELNPYEFTEWVEKECYAKAGINPSNDNFSYFTVDHLNRLSPLVLYIIRLGNTVPYVETIDLLVNYFAESSYNKGEPVNTTAGIGLEQMFSETYESNHKDGESGEVETTVIESTEPTETIAQEKPVDTEVENSDEPSETVENTPTEPMDILKKLKKDYPDKVEELKDNYSVKIALDILSRGLTYKNLSYKQKYRVDDAIAILSGTKGAKDKKSKSSDNTKSTVSSDENETFLLADHPEIKAKVDKIISKADSVEMQEVFKVSPKVVQICYSIVRYNKASTRQLKHVDLAIEILDRQ